ncbi:MAG: hypothetical protein AB8B63_05620 [Granulosicoccus sp.]
MIPPLNEGELISILKIMEQMVVKAENSDWPALSFLDKERRIIILGEDSGESGTTGMPDKYSYRSAFEEPVDNKPGPGRKKETDINTCQSSRQVTVEKIMKIDKYLNDTLTKARKSLLMESRQHKDQIKAKKHYEMASDLT